MKNKIIYQLAPVPARQLRVRQNGRAYLVQATFRAPGALREALGPGVHDPNSKSFLGLVG